MITVVTVRSAFLPLLCATLCVLTAGCATPASPIKQSTQPRNLGIVTQGEHCRVEVLDILQPGDPHHWVEDAKWTELVLRVTNTCTTPLIAREAHLLNANGAMIPAAQNPMMLADIQKQVSQSLGAAQTTSTAITAGQQALQVIPGLAPAAAGAIPYLGPVISLIGHFAVQQQATAMMSAAQRPHATMDEIQRRSIPMGMGIVPGGHIQGSVFFPYTNTPEKVLFSYEREGTKRMMEASLVQATAGLNARAETAVLRTEQAEVRLAAGVTPVALGQPKELLSMGITFSRNLSPLEVQNLQIGFSGGFPCEKAGQSEWDQQGRSVMFSKYPTGCLGGARGTYGLLIAGLNVEIAAFPIQVGLPPETKLTMQTPPPVPVPDPSAQPTPAPKSTAMVTPQVQPTPPPRPTAMVTPDAPKNPYVEVIVNSAIIRDEPDGKNRIKSVPKGTRLEKLDQAGKWTKVLVDGDKIGWVSSGLIKEVPAERVGASDVIHVFQAGESLSDIAARYTGSAENWKPIADYNGITDASQLSVGRGIKIPGSLVRR